MEKNSWLIKYKPKTSTEIVSNKKAVDDFRKFIDQFYKKNVTPIDGNIIIVGNHGIGKKLIVDTILKEAGIVKIYPQSTKTTNTKKKNAENYYNRLCNQRNLSDIDNDFTKIKFAYIVDNIENISSTSDREMIKKIIKINDKLKKFPIVIITNPKHNKTINTLKK